METYRELLDWRGIYIVGSPLFYYIDPMKESNIPLLLDINVPLYTHLKNEHRLDAVNQRIIRSLKQSGSVMEVDQEEEVHTFKKRSRQEMEADKESITTHSPLKNIKFDSITKEMLHVPMSIMKK